MPSVRTTRKYLSLVNTQCGFDKQFFQLLKKKFSMLTFNQKHGMLIFDEICVRESISVNSKTLNYSGLEDFGENVQSSGLKANHCLVFIFQSLAANISQPIAVFASRGPVKGNIILLNICIVVVICQFVIIL